jgi:hypothetical protein
MRKIAVIGMVAVLMLTATGCGSNDITLTEDQNSKVSEYVAGALLKHSYDNEWKYEKLKKAESTGTATTSSTTSSTTATSGTATSGTATETGTATGTAATTASTAKTLTEALKLSGATISYSNYSVGATYPTGEYMISVPADSGCKVVAVEFTIHNTSASDITVNTKSSGVTMKLTVNGTPVPEAMTMLSSDISALNNVSISAGSSYTAAAIFQVSDGLADNISSMSLTASINSTTLDTISIK